MLRPWLKHGTRIIVPFDRRERGSQQFAGENALHRLERVEDALQHRRAIIAVSGGLVAGKELGEPRQRGRVIDGRGEIENVSKIHVAVLPAKEGKGIALGDRGAWIAAQRFEAPLDAIQHHQVVIGAQRAEFGRDLMHAFAELVEGVHLARKFRIFQFEIRKLGDLAIGVSLLRLAGIENQDMTLRLLCPEIGQQGVQLLRSVVGRNDKSEILHHGPAVLI